MNVIFLDIDGVMNSHVYAEKQHKKRWLKPKTYYYRLRYIIRYVFNGFKPKYVSLNLYKPNPDFGTVPYLYKRLMEETDKEKWKWLVEFCNDNDIKICISSVWKNSLNNEKEWEDVLQRIGFKPNTSVGITGDRRTLRGTEIQEFIDKTEGITNYAIIDDDSDMLESQKAHFFHVDQYYGLSPNTLYRIGRLFNEK